jgi:methanogenic corrinoid protein MtbC1
MLLINLEKLMPNSINIGDTNINTNREIIDNIDKILKIFYRSTYPKMTVRESLAEAVVLLKYAEIADLVERELGSGASPLKLLYDVKKGLEIVGEKYYQREYFLSELYMAAETARIAIDRLKPLLSNESDSISEGTVVVGSIQGDIHDFGKLILITFLTASGYKIYDLGVDVLPEMFVYEAQKVNADVIGVSTLLSSTQPTVRKVIEVLEKRNMRKRFKVILGGTGVTKQAEDMFRVDAAVNDASEGLKIIKSWIVQKRRN